MRVATVVSCLFLAVSAHQPWLDASLPIPKRVQLLMDQMTLTERARQTYAVHNLPQFTGSFKSDLGQTSFGSLKLSGIQTSVAAEQLAMRNALQAFVVNASRLSIPVSWHNEVLLSAAPQATNFPLPVSLGASFNRTLVERVHEVIALETRYTGADVGYAPEVNLYTDGRFGRLQEGFGEDPLHTSKLAVAAVHGLQGDGGSGPATPLPWGRVAALAKHYLAYGAGAGGQNVGATDMSERTLREIFLEPWRQMVDKAGLRGLMPSHQTLFDVPVHGNAWVGQELLRKELNWTFGLSVSDCSDIGALISWGLAADPVHAAALGLEASVDMDNMCSTNADGKWTYQHIEEAVHAGLVQEKRVNESCSRVLAQKFAAGLFEQPITDISNSTLAATLDNSTHRRIALEAAEQGLVLLLNRNATLPLSLSHVGTRAKRHGVALIGESASCTFDDKEGARPFSGHDVQCKAQLNMLGKTQHNVGNVSIVTVASAIARANAQDGAQPPLPLSGTLLGAAVDSPTPETDKQAAVALANRSGLALLVLGDSERSCGEWGDRSSLSLPKDQPELLLRVLETGVPTVLVLVHGRPVSFDIEPSSNSFGHDSLLDFDNLVAVVAAWRPGEEGGTAIVNLLLGRMVTGGGGPSGRLAQAWPRTVGQIGGPASPWFHQRNGKWTANTKGPQDPVDGLYHFDPYVNAPSTPLFAFGAGLGFATFEFGASTASVDAGGRSVSVTTTVANTAAVAGAQTVLVFATAPLDSVVRYYKRLVGFTKVLVPASTSNTVTISIDVDDLAVYATAQPGAPGAGERKVLHGKYNVSVGGSSDSDLSITSFTL